MTILKPVKKLKKMDAIIDANPDIVETVNADLTKGAKSVGHRSMGAERFLRCAILKQWKKPSPTEFGHQVLLAWTGKGHPKTLGNSPK